MGKSAILCLLLTWACRPAAVAQTLPSLLPFTLQRPSERVTVINAADSLLLVSKTGERDLFLFRAIALKYPRSIIAEMAARKVPRQYVTDYHRKLLLPVQDRAIVAACYYQDIFYALTRQDSAYHIRSEGNWCGGSGSNPALYEYTYHLIGADGKPVKGLESYNLLAYADSTGHLVPESEGKVPYGLKEFSGVFQGCFLARTRDQWSQRKGFVTVNGRVLFPGVSFQYYELSVLGPDLFLVNRAPPKPLELYPPLPDSLIWSMPMPADDAKKLQRGLPYLVNGHNQVLLDSLTVESVANVAPPGAMPWYLVTIKGPLSPDPQAAPIHFYIEGNGRAYQGDLPGDKKQQPTPRKATGRSRSHGTRR